MNFSSNNKSDSCVDQIQTVARFKGLLKTFTKRVGPGANTIDSSDIFEALPELMAKVIAEPNHHAETIAMPRCKQSSIT